MTTTDAQTIAQIILTTPKRETYIDFKPLKGFAAPLQKHKKDVLSILLKSNLDKLDICERYCWAFSFFGEGLSEVERGYNMDRMGLFGLMNLGIPKQEMPLLTSAIVSFFMDYAENAEENPRDYESYKNAEKHFYEYRDIFSRDPRYKEIFDALNLGIFR